MATTNLPLERLGAMAWKHPNGSVMLIAFSHHRNASQPFGMMRELIGTDGVCRRGFADWRTLDGARAEWRAMVERYTARGWRRVEVPADGDPWTLR